MAFQFASDGLMRMVSGGGPGDRSLYMKLPLDDVRFHWKFFDKEAFLEGSLEVEIHGATGRDTVLTVFRDGEISPDWHPIDSQRGEGEIYFGFIGEVEVWTHRRDSVVVRLHAARDLEGIGRYEEAVLPEGSYEASASYSILTGHPRFRLFSQPSEPRAYIGCWRSKWEMELSGEPGWTGTRGEPEDSRFLARLAQMMPSVGAEQGTDGSRCAS
ncbi:MAG: hypothetical protein EA352_02310 [Gemmatimonadales bacterium]|nr:MAG: hypothetical protein EA352_02310 [Gemmatimonadales bacterium]